jgi:hypothetical protein
MTYKTWCKISTDIILKIMYIFLKKTCSFENDSRKNEWEKAGSVIYLYLKAKLNC